MRDPEEEEQLNCFKEVYIGETTSQETVDLDLDQITGDGNF